MKRIGLNCGKIYLSKLDYYSVIALTLLASFDLFRAYAEIGILNAFFSIKEFIIIGLFTLYFCYKKIRIRSSNVFYFIFLILYMILNCRNDKGVILLFVYIKYVIVYLLGYLLLSQLNVDLLKSGCKIVTGIFGFYSIFSVIQGFLFPDTLVRSGRISGSANPSFISLIYLYSFIFCFFNKKTISALWFLVVGVLTMTKTFFVTAPIVSMTAIFFSKKRKIVILLIAFIIPILSFVIKNNIELYYTFDRAYKVLIERDGNEYNSMDDRIDRIENFERQNSGFFLFGYGTGRASSAAIFVNEKLNTNINGTLDFENQYLNIYYSMGLVGILLLYLPILSIIKCVFNKEIKFKCKLEFYLYLISFLLFSITLNLIESFTGVLISLLFLVYSQKNVCDIHRLQNVSV